MANKSTADVILAIRQHSNTVNRKVVTDDEVLARANEGLWELYDLIDGAHGTYFVKPFSFSLVGGYGGNTAPLPSDFYRAKALDKAPDTSAMRSVNALPSFAERNSPQTLSYDLEDVANIMLVPPVQSQGDYRLRYIPKCPQLATPIVVRSTNPPRPVTSLIPVPTVKTPPTVLTGRLLGSLWANQADLLVQVIDTAIAAGWFCVQSYNANGVLPAPGVNTWTDYLQLHDSSHGTGASWIVLGNPWNAMQICYLITVSASVTGWMEVNKIVAPAGGFTGGTTLARPTAPGELSIPGNEWLGTTPQGNPQFYALVWNALDGSYLRIAWIYGGKLKSLWRYEMLQDAPTGWTKNVMFDDFSWSNVDYTVTGLRATTDIFTKNWGSAGTRKFVLTPDPDTVSNVNGFLESGGGSGFIPDQQPSPFRSSNQYIWVGPLGFVQSSSNGVLGYSIDNWWTVPSVFNDCDTAGDNYDFIIFNQLMLEWGIGPVGSGLGLSTPSTNYPTSRWYGRS